MEKLSNHQVKFRDAQFVKEYIAQCANCKIVLFQLSTVNKMLKWNGQSLLQLKSEVVPTTLTVSKNKLSPKSGTYMHNIYTTMSCICNAVVGIHLLAPCWDTQILEKQLLIEANKLRIVLIEDKNIVEVDLLSEFNGEGFIEYKPPSINKPAIKAREEGKQDEEVNLKNRSSIRRKDEISREEIKQVVLYFGKVLTDLDQRVGQLENSVRACINVVHRVLPKDALNQKQRL